MIPSVGRSVHYVSYGTPGGEYSKTCRAATITEVKKLRKEVICLEEDLYKVSLCVINPTGLFFNEEVPYYQWDSNEADEWAEMMGGTWHWPERVQD